MSVNFMMQILTACVAISFMINLMVEVEKKLLPKFPSTILAFLSSIVATAAAAIAYITANGIPVTVALVIGIAALCIAEAYIAMFGYDKFIQTMKQ